MSPKKTRARTLSIDIGGSGIKSMVLDRDGEAITERLREPTPSPAAAAAVLDVIKRMLAKHSDFDRVSVGFPGVVTDGVVRTAPNLKTELWVDYDLQNAIAEVARVPTRVLNDADMAGYGAISGKGVEMALTLGTGLGAALFANGKLFPNLELGHHPFRKGETYEERVCNVERKRIGNRKWSRRVLRAIEQLEPIFNYDRLYLGGGNSKHLQVELPTNVEVVDNRAALLGGIRLWA